MASSIITVSMKPKNVEHFESLPLDFDTDLSKVVVALVIYCRDNLKDKKFKEAISKIIDNE